MKTIEIPPADRPQFLSGFARQHFGWLSRLRIAEKGIEQPPSELLPLNAIESLPDGDTRIALGDKQELAHSVISVRLLQTDDGSDAGLEFETHGRTLHLEFRVAAHPETIDGILPSEAA